MSRVRVTKRTEKDWRNKKFFFNKSKNKNSGDPRKITQPH